MKLSEFIASAQRDPQTLTWADKDNWPLHWFTPQELACKGTGGLRIDRDAGECLDRLRQALGRPVVVVSGYRSPSYNAKVGGAPHSYHLRGMAFDCRYDSAVEGIDLLDTARAVGFRGIGVYRTFLHLDLGPRRLWWG